MDKVDIFFDEYLPSEFIQKFWLIWVVDTIKQIHFPTNIDLNKFVFDENFNEVDIDKIEVHNNGTVCD